MTPDQAAKLTLDNRWFRHFMPYAFVRLDHPKRRHVFLPVNRNYKPLGQTSSKWVEYREFLDSAVVFRRDPKQMSGVWTATREHLHLYNDNPKSRLNYFERPSRVLAAADSFAALETDPRFR